MIKRPLLLFLAVLLTLPVRADFDFNANCLKAYQNIFELKLVAARQLIATEKKKNPDNLIVPLLENYVDYFYLLTTENKTDFERLEAHKSERLNKISSGSKNSPYYLYAQAEINLQWALVRGRYEEYFTAAREIRRASSLLQDNQKKFPDFVLNNKGLGLIDAFLGNLPDGMLKRTLATFGIKGELSHGMALLDRLSETLPASRFEPFYEEVVFYYCYVLNDIAHSPQAYAKTMKYTGRIPDSSLLKTYLRAQVCAKNGHNEEAIQILAGRPSGAAYQPFPYLELLEGIARLNKLELAAAGNFNRFLRENRGVNFVKDAYLHLGWIALLKNDTNGYASMMGKVRSAGFVYQERDKQALNEAGEPIPDLVLLKARLLFDGGYYEQAMQLLSDKKPAQFTAERDQAEFHYRLARINNELGKTAAALSNFQLTIQKGLKLKYYYAANSALLMGKIYEQGKNVTKARQYFNMAIQMKDHDYERSIETQAKAGLNRLK